MQAIALPLRAAVRALAAPRIRHHHVVAGLELGHRAADGAHDAGAFVAEHCRETASGNSRRGRADRSRTCRWRRPRPAIRRRADRTDRAVSIVKGARTLAHDGGGDLHGCLMFGSIPRRRALRVRHALDRLGEIFRRLRARHREHAAEDEAGHAVDAGFLGGLRLAARPRRRPASLASSSRISSASSPTSAAACTSTSRSVRSAPSVK